MDDHSYYYYDFDNNDGVAVARRAKVMMRLFDLLVQFFTMPDQFLIPIITLMALCALVGLLSLGRRRIK